MPLIADQPFWASQVVKHQIGNDAVIPVSELTEDKLVNTLQSTPHVNRRDKYDTVLLDWCKRGLRSSLNWLNKKMESQPPRNFSKNIARETKTQGILHVLG